MAYVEQYPLNLTPQGDSTKDAVLKNREEIKTIGNTLAAQLKGGGSGLRQRILYGKNNGGKYSFLSSVGLSIIVDGSNVPVVLTLANGFDENGAKDYVGTINKKINAWTLPGNATSYLFVERSLSGALSYGSVTIKPVFADALSSGIPVDSHIFNTLEQKMYMYNGTEWKAVVRVFIAAVTTNSTDVTSIDYLENESDMAFSGEERQKLSGVADHAEVNQNAYAKVKVGSDLLAAAVKQAVLELIAGDHIILTPDVQNGTIKIALDTIKAQDITGMDKYQKKTDVIQLQNGNEVNFTDSMNDSIRFGHRAGKVIGHYSFDTGENQGKYAKIYNAGLNIFENGSTTKNGTIRYEDNTFRLSSPISMAENNDLDALATSNVSGVSFHPFSGVTINGTQYWGTSLTIPWNVNDGRRLGIQIAFCNSEGAFIRFPETPTKLRTWQRIYTDGEVPGGKIWFA